MWSTGTSARARRCLKKEVSATRGLFFFLRRWLSKSLLDLAQPGLRRDLDIRLGGTKTARARDKIVFETAPRGFSLIELTVVLAVAGLIATAVLPRLSLMDGDSRLRLAGRRLTAAVRLARSEAVTGGQITGLTLTAGGNLRISQGDSLLGSENLPQGVELLGLSIRNRAPAEGAELYFWPNGRASEAALYLGSGGQMMTFHLSPLTGRLEAREGRVVYDWSG